MRFSLTRILTIPFYGATERGNRRWLWKTFNQLLLPGIDSTIFVLESVI